MAPSLKLGHLPRYGELARLLVSHRDALGGAGTEGDPDASPELQADAERLVAELQAMGPTYVKLGQLLSTREDLLPSVYVDALRRLQDRADPMPIETVRAVVEEELGRRLASSFPSFVAVPIGAASLGQVHRATLPDGTLVAVKVQRPGVRARIVDDMDVVGELATAFDEHVGAARNVGLCAMVEEFRRALLHELDYRHEAASMRMLAELLAPYDLLFTPRPLDELTTGRLLTMTLVEGDNAAAVPAGVLGAEQGSAAVDQLYKAYLDQVLVRGVFHADPHPGNVLVTTDGRLALIDVGMTATLDPDLRETMLRLLVALGDGRGDAVADALEHAGEPQPGFDRRRFARDVSSLVATVEGARVGDLEVGRQLAQLARISARAGLRPAPELSMVGKALLNLDEVASRLAPSYQPAGAIREHTAEIMRHHMLEAASPTRLVSAALDAKEFAERLPQRMNKVLDTMAEGSFRVSVDGMDEAELMRSVQKLANRAASGLAVAAFVLAAAIFSISSSGPRWGGVSAFTVVLLGLAAVVGAAIVLATLRHDVPQRRRLRRRRR